MKLSSITLSIFLIVTSLFSTDKKSSTPTQKPIFVYCAAGMRVPIDKLTKMFEQEQLGKVEITYDGSNRLLGQIELSNRGDLYISGDAEYVDLAKQKGLVTESKTICYFIPVIMVQKGNPKKITSLEDLLKPNIKIGQGDEKAAAVGRVTIKILNQNSIDYNTWKKNVVLVTPTVNELANAIKLGTIDAAIVWNAIAASYPNDADVVKILSQKNIFPKVEAGILKASKNVKCAKLFLSFITSEKGRRTLSENGYSVNKP